MNLLEVILIELAFIIVFCLVFGGSTTFSGEWLPPPIIIKFICWLFNSSTDKENENNVSNEEEI